MSGRPALAADTAPPDEPAIADICAKTDGLEPRVLGLALKAFARAKASGEIKSDVLTVIDYSRPSRQRRLWVIDVASKEVLFHELVAHGKNTGDDRARSFSNELGSLQSSLGLFVTDATYQGKHGHSLKLRGLDKGLNDRALERAIVVHAADYVSLDFVRKHHRLGRSWGCPALAPEVAKPVIERIKGGSAIFAYFPAPELLRVARDL